MRCEQTVDILGQHAPVVEALRENDDVACEAVAADVGRLPHTVGLRRSAEGVVEWPAVPRAARVTLAVRADHEQRFLHRRCLGRCARERRDEVELAQVVLMVDLELEQPLVPLLRRSEEHHPARPRSPLRLPDEEEARMR